jgi:hypothetical protein
MNHRKQPFPRIHSRLYFLMKRPREICAALSYNFSSAQANAYGGNLIPENGNWCIYSGLKRVVQYN